MMDCFRVNAVAVELGAQYFGDLLKKSTGKPCIVTITSGAGSIGNRLSPDGIANDNKVLPYRVSKAALHHGVCKSVSRV